MNVTIIGVGKIKEKYWLDAIAEYSKRLGRYVSLNLVQCQDEPTPDGASKAEEDKIRQKEAQRILAAIERCPSGSHVIALAIEGKMTDSVGMAEHIQKLSVQGVSSLVYVIGGSLGLDGSVLSRADELLSFSKLTFPHQMMRVILLEQIYRSFRIMRHEPYHK